MIFSGGRYLIDLAGRIASFLLGPRFFHIAGAFQLSQILVEGTTTQIDEGGVETAFDLLAQLVAMARLFREEAKDDKLNTHKVFLPEQFKWTI